MKHTKKLLAILLVLCMVMTLTFTAFAADEPGEMAGKIVILHSNDVHGAIAGYAKIAGLRDDYVAKAQKSSWQMWATFRKAIPLSACTRERPRSI